jgi:hypothetical protein
VSQYSPGTTGGNLISNEISSPERLPAETVQQMGELAFSTVMTGSDIGWFVSDQISEALFHFSKLADT